MHRLAARIVTAYVRSNPLPVADVPVLLSQVVAALERASTGVEAVPELSPAVPVKKSITPEAIICLECGARQKSMRRHIRTSHGMSPEEYRARWGLGSDYPMVAPDYADRRSQLAKASGLGRKPEKSVEPAQPEPAKGKAGFSYPASRWSKPAK